MTSEEERLFEDDDEAIDATGASEHPYEIVLTEGERLVARFASQAARTGFFDPLD